MIEHSPNGYRCQCGCYHGKHRHNRVTLSALCPKCRDDLNRESVEADYDMETVRDAEATGVLLPFPSGL
jgi:hypothetical protein